VFQGCRENSEEVFGCPPKHVIEVHEVTVGIIPNENSQTVSGHCLLDEAVCSWPIFQPSIMRDCNREQSMCKLNLTAHQSVACSQNQGTFFMKITYHCRESERETEVKGSLL